MSELIREYGAAMVSALVGALAVGLLVYSCVQIASYLEFFSDCLMGGGR